MLDFYGPRVAYDAFGNLIERIGADGSKMELGYDGADRFLSLWRREPNGHITEARYAYDALGRRIRKEVVEHDGESRIRYGWEGDRQVAEDIDDELIRTTIYEPESFVPLARIEMRPAGPGEDAETKNSLKPRPCSRRSSTRCWRAAWLCPRNSSKRSNHSRSRQSASAGSTPITWARHWH